MATNENGETVALFATKQWAALPSSSPSPSPSSRCSSVNLFRILQKLHPLDDASTVLPSAQIYEMLLRILEHCPPYCLPLLMFALRCLNRDNMMTSKQFFNVLILAIKNNHLHATRALLHAASASDKPLKLDKHSQALLDEFLYEVSMDDKEPAHVRVQFWLVEREAVNAIAEVDEHRRTLLHWCVSPCEIGSYENADMVNTLLRHGVQVEATDGDGKTALDLARRQHSGVMAKVLLDSCLVSGEMPSLYVTDIPFWDQADFAERCFEDDAKLTRKCVQQEGLNDMDLAVPDVLSSFQLNEPHAQVVLDEDAASPECAYLDVQFGKVELHGDDVPPTYTRCHLQLVLDHTQQQFVLLFETAPHHHFQETNSSSSPSFSLEKTVFASLEEGRHEFVNTFKAKTGNEWTDIPYGVHANKFRVWPRDHKRVREDVLPPSLSENCTENAAVVRSTLSSSLQRLVEPISDLSILRQAYQAIITTVNHCVMIGACFLSISYGCMYVCVCVCVFRICLWVSCLVMLSILLYLCWLRFVWQCCRLKVWTAITKSAAKPGKWSLNCRRVISPQFVVVMLGEIVWLECLKPLMRLTWSHRTLTNSTISLWHPKSYWEPFPN